MAAAFVPYDKTKTPDSEAYNGLQMILRGIAKLGAARQVMIDQIDGATNDPAHYDLRVSQGGFTAGQYATPNAAAMAAFQQLDSLYAILTRLTPSGVNNDGDAAGAALNQTCGMLGVI